MGYVDGSEPQPAAIQVKEAAQWKVNNAKVISWILGSMDTSIGIPMRGLHTAKDMWEYLEKVYQQSNFSRKFQVEHDIFIYGQGEKSIQDYYAGFMNLWTEYEFVTMGKITTACCLRALKDINDERKVMQFLMKPRPDYEIVRANFLNRDTLPTMDVVLGELLREETRIATQATLERKTELDSIIWESGQPHSLRTYQKCSALNVKNLAMWCHIVERRTLAFIASKPGILLLNVLKFRKKAAADVLSDGSSIDAPPQSDCGFNSTVNPAPPISDEIRHLVQSSVSSAISSAFSAIGLSVNQRKYTMDLIKCANLTDQKCIDTPMEPNLKLKKDAGEWLSDPTHYRQLVGRLVYLTMTRPDISYAVNTVSQFVSDPRRLHLAAVH
ncbi:hypothetical protein RJ639_007985 [Escallonia herrerae]|uniref:Gag-pol polyprotein n=1 Tax=Escallonia herrerae TaxID=1293975 RepID=A0AA88VR95_9ASTE|nr:hypothetical protein RJ639_007985 [Escallonia herrerae]